MQCNTWQPMMSSPVLQVTADGSMDCSKNPERQEAMLSHLLLCQTVAALLLLKPKGNLILKTFTMLEAGSISLMYLLACCFNEVGGVYCLV